jgi:DNA-binding CsgD family transcriptional regulator
MSVQRLGIRHIETIERASWGLINREIGYQLGIAARTVDGLMDDARRLLDASNRPHLVARAVTLGLIEPRDWSALQLLSRRQLDVVEALARGLSGVEISLALGVQHPTVATHLRRTRRTTGCRTSSELAALVASRSRLTDAPPATDSLDDTLDAMAQAVLMRSSRGVTGSVQRAITA